MAPVLSPGEPIVDEAKFLYPDAEFPVMVLFVIAGEPELQ